jgi:hypothetical protein
MAQNRKAGKDAGELMSVERVILRCRARSGVALRRQALRKITREGVEMKRSGGGATSRFYGVRRGALRKERRS